MANRHHLILIQGVITRLAGESASAKRSAVVVVAALLGFASANSNYGFAVIALYVLVVLWLLDAYYLALERAYRRLYDDTVAGDAPEWSMRTPPPSRGDIVSAAGSVSIAPLYVVSLISALAVALLIVLV